METTERAAPAHTTEAAVATQGAPSAPDASATAVSASPTTADTASTPAAPAVALSSEKELLCTICNLRACWEAPANA